MSINFKMLFYETRAASFRPIASGQRKKAPQQWPHKSPTPADLASAGFYYKPQADSNDNVVCFMCKKNLNGWDPNDDPIQEHYTHAQDCPWAVTFHCRQEALRVKNALDNGEEAVLDHDVNGDIYVDAREKTFCNIWPHEKKKAFVGKTRKIAQAGFFFTPTPTSDDYVSCVYCQLGLDGWERQDDPLEEHQKRSEDCLYFKGHTVSHNLTSEAKPQTGKRSRRKRANSASSVSAPDQMSLKSSPSSVRATSETVNPRKRKSSLISGSPSSMKSWGSQPKRRRAPRDSAASTMTEEIVVKKTRGRKARVIFINEDDDSDRKTRSSLNPPERRSSRRVSGRNSTKTMDSFTPAPTIGKKNTKKPRNARVRDSQIKVIGISGAEPVMEQDENALHPIHEYTETDDQAESTDIGQEKLKGQNSTLKDPLSKVPETLEASSKVVAKVRKSSSVTDSDKFDENMVSKESQISLLDKPKSDPSRYGEFGVIRAISSSYPQENLSWNPVDPVTLFNTPDLIPKDLSFSESELDMPVSKYLLYVGEKEVEAVALKFDKMIEKLRSFGDSAVSKLEQIGH